MSQAIDELFPPDRSVGGEIMRALVAGNSATLRTPSGFAETARRAVRALHERGTDAADAAAREIEGLLADSDLLEHCRLALLET